MSNEVVLTIINKAKKDVWVALQRLDVNSECAANTVKEFKYKSGFGSGLPELDRSLIDLRTYIANMQRDLGLLEKAVESRKVATAIMGEG